VDLHLKTGTEFFKKIESGKPINKMALKISIQVPYRRRLLLCFGDTYSAVSGYRLGIINPG